MAFGFILVARANINPKIWQRELSLSSGADTLDFGGQNIAQSHATTVAVSKLVWIPLKLLKS